MRWIFAIFLVLFSFPCFAKEKGLDVPKEIKKRNLGPSQLVTPPMNIQKFCSIYDGKALLWKEDPGIKGIGQVIVRWGSNSQLLCSPNFSGRSKAIPLRSAVWPLGLSGDNLFVQQEPFGNMANYFVIDIQSGKEIFSSWRDLEGDLRIEKNVVSISLNFRMGLDKLPCSPSKGDANCWKKIRATNRIPNEVSVVPPDCEAAFKKYPSLRNNPKGLAISVPVRVNNLAAPKILFQDGRASCRDLP